MIIECCCTWLAAKCAEHEATIKHFIRREIGTSKYHETEMKNDWNIISKLLPKRENRLHIGLSTEPNSNRL